MATGDFCPSCGFGYGGAGLCPMCRAERDGRAVRIMGTSALASAERAVVSAAEAWEAATAEREAFYAQSRGDQELGMKLDNAAWAARKKLRSACAALARVKGEGHADR